VARGLLNGALHTQAFQHGHPRTAEQHQPSTAAQHRKRRMAHSPATTGVALSDSFLVGYRQSPVNHCLTWRRRGCLSGPVPGPPLCTGQGREPGHGSAHARKQLRLQRAQRRPAAAAAQGSRRSRGAQRGARARAWGQTG